MQFEIKPTEFGIYIRNKRLDKNISLRSFCKMLEISPSYLSMIETKQYIPPEKIIKKIADALELNFLYLCGLAGKIPKVTSERIVENILTHPKRVEFFRATKDIKYLIKNEI
jgi:transcriptional regulator with XRE-family HTH domain